MRCIFSESLNESALHVSHGAPPAIGAGPDAGRSSARTQKSPSRIAYSVTGTFRAFADDLVTTLFPADCRTCDRPLSRATQFPVCETCLARIHQQTSALCQRCGEALDLDTPRFAQPAEGLLCSPCRFAPPMFERAVAHAIYQGELREMIHLLKYERMHTAAKPLGKLLAQTILTLEPEAARSLTVVAVPLSKAHQRQRGYNQSEILADAALAELRTLRPTWQFSRPPALLVRHRDTRSQFELTPRGRRRNVEGAFSVDDTRLPLNAEVLLIDDIYTTGATARECARVLRRAGAAKVWVATLARAQTPRIALWDEAHLQAPRAFT